MQKKILDADQMLQDRLSEEVYFLQWQPQNIYHFLWNGDEYTSGNDFIEKILHKNIGFVGFPLWLVFDSEGRLMYQNDGLLRDRQISEILDLLKNEKS